jgi:hypothetical protein
MAESEVARLRAQIEREYEAALRGLLGLAVCARHDFINARLRQIGELESELSLHVGPTQAMETLLEIHDNQVRRYLQQIEGGQPGADGAPCPDGGERSATEVAAESALPSAADEGPLPV